MPQRSKKPAPFKEKAVRDKDAPDKGILKGHKHSHAPRKVNSRHKAL